MHSVDMRDWASISFNLVVLGLGSVGVVIMVAPVVVGFLMSLTAGDTIQFPPEGLSLRWYAALFDPAQSSRILSAGLTSLQIAALATTTVAIVWLPFLPHLRGCRRAQIRLPRTFLHAAARPPDARLRSGGADVLRQHWHPAVLLAGGSRSHGRFRRLVFRTTVAVVSQLSPTLGESSLILGASRAHTLRRITLPLIMPGILGGALLVFMASMDNVSVSLFLADARTNVLPIRMWRMIESPWMYASPRFRAW